MPGYDANMFIVAPGSELLCQICTAVLKDPVSVCNEGHEFCRDCLETWFRTESSSEDASEDEEEHVKTCPTCREHIANASEQMRPVRFLKNTIEKLVVRCRFNKDDESNILQNKTNEPPRKRSRTTKHTVAGLRKLLADLGQDITGKKAELIARLETASKVTKCCCDWTGPLSELEKHNKECIGEGCGGTFSLDTIDSHRLQCASVLVSCPHDGCPCREKREYLESHFENCEFGYIVCGQGMGRRYPYNRSCDEPTRCTERIHPKNWEHHLSKECKYNKITCPNLGCQISGPGLDMGGIGGHLEHCLYKCPTCRNRILPDDFEKHVCHKTLRIIVKDQNGEEFFFKVKFNTKMGKVFEALAGRKGIRRGALRLLCDGRRITDDDTPLTLELEDGDQIDCLLECSGSDRRIKRDVYFQN